MDKPQVRIGIAGLGTVAQGILSILARSGEEIQARSGIALCVTRVVSRTPKPEVDLGGATFTTNLHDLLGSDVDLVVEVMGGETAAYDLIEAALAQGKPVVTANKAVIASRGNQLLSRPGAALGFEAAVAGAIPIIQAIRQGLVANQFESVMGIINGTCNYILTAMQEQGAAFEDALRTAQELGYAEADPEFDVEGIDAAHKLTILLALVFRHEFDFDALYVEGITQVTSEDIRYADELGYRIKHLGIARQTTAGLEARLHPTLIAKSNLLSSVNGVENAVQVVADAAGTTLFAGPGAGGEATASAILADVVNIAQTSMSGERGAMGATDGRKQARILPIDEVVCPHYIRIPTRDEAGVFAQVAQTLSGHGISIEAVIQKEPATDVASIVLLTSPVQEATVVAAIAQVQQMPQVAGDIARIRVDSLH